jgi:hypothetical protein
MLIGAFLPSCSVSVSFAVVLPVFTPVFSVQSIMYRNLLWIKSFSASMGDDVCNGLSMGGGTIARAAAAVVVVVLLELR